MDVIQTLRNAIRLYEQHHPHCLVIPEDARASLDQALESFGALYNSPEEAPQHEPLRESRIILFSGSPTSSSIIGREQRKATSHQALEALSERYKSPNELQIIPFSNTSLSGSNQTSKKRRLDGRTPSSKLIVDGTLREVPNIETLDSKLKQISVIISNRIVQRSLSPSQITDYVHQPSDLPTTTVEIAEYHAEQTALWITKAEDTDLICRFHLFSFLSYTVVLEDTGIIDLPKLNNTMKVVTSKDESKDKDGDQAKYLKQLRSSARLLHTDVILKLVKAGWSISLATLIVIICAPQRPYQYAYFTSKNVQEIVQKFVQQFQGKKDDYPKYERTSFCMAEWIAGWDLSLCIKRTHKALGYDYKSVHPSSSIERDQPQNSQVWPSSPFQTEALSGVSASHTSQDERMHVDQRVAAPICLNFHAVLNQAEAQLLSLLHFSTSAKHPINEILLKAAGGVRKRWAPSGDTEDFGIGDLGLSLETVTFLQNGVELDRLLSRLKAAGLIKQFESDKSKEWMINSQIRDITEFGAIDEANGLEQAMKFACFFFTGCEYIGGFREQALRALPLFQRLLDQFLSCDSHRLTHIIVPALLQSSKFLDFQWKQRSIAIAEKFSVHDLAIDVRAYFAYRKSFILRSNNNLDEAEKVIITYFATAPPASEVDPRLNAIHGLLIHSKSWVHIARAQFEEARSTASSWTPSPCEPLRFKPLYEVRAEQRLLAVRGIASKHLGDLECAILELQSAFNAYHNADRARLYVLANLSDAYCEKKNPAHALAIVQEELKRLDIQPLDVERTVLDDMYLRNLLISMAESSIYLQLHKQAFAILLQLKSYYDRRLITGKNDQQRHVRTLLLLAQSYHQQAAKGGQWSTALNAWQELVFIVDKYKIISGTGWDFGLICLSIHHAEQGTHSHGSNNWLRIVVDNFQTADHFWMRSIPTYWAEYILKSNLSISSELSESIKRCIGLV